MNKKQLFEVLNNLHLNFLLFLYRWIRYYLFPQIKFVWYHTFFFLPYSSQCKLKKLKGTKNGRCFIIGTGPSLTIEDLSKLINEDTFGANSLCTLFNKVPGSQTKSASWKPTWFGFQDWEVYTKNSDIIDSLDPNTVFYNSEVLWHLGRKRFPLWKSAIPFHSKYHKHYLCYGKDLKTGFSKNASLYVHDGYTILYSLLQIAVYIGYTEIYLIGADCNYDQKVQHSSACTNDVVTQGINRTLSGPAMIASYQVAKKYADSHNIKIYNATRGGMLEVFPRVNLDDILKK